MEKWSVQCLLPSGLHTSHVKTVNSLCSRKTQNFLYKIWDHLFLAFCLMTVKIAADELIKQLIIKNAAEIVKFAV